MNKWKLLLGLTVALCVVTGGPGLVSSASAPTNGYTLDWYVIGGGGNVSTQLNSTVGQTATGWSTGAKQLGSGFWYGAEAGGVVYKYKLYLPLTRKNY